MNIKWPAKKLVSTILGIALCSLLLLFILANIPWKTRIDLKMTCSQIAEDGTVLSTGETVKIKGWKQSYLFNRSGEIVLESFMLPEFYAPASTHSDGPLIVAGIEPGPYAAFGYILYTSKVRDIYISFEEDWKTCLISLDFGDYIYACSLEDTVPVADIIEIHKWMLD